MDERFAALTGLFLAELGSFACLAIVSPSNAVFRGTVTRWDLLTPHAGGVFLFFAIIAGLVWVVSPTTYRIRQGTGSKLKALTWVVLTIVALSNAVMIYLFEEGVPGAMAVPDPGHESGGLGLALAILTVTGLALFWIAVLLLLWISKRRVVQVTPNPKFGRG